MLTSPCSSYSRFDTSSIALRHYLGWGVKGNNVLFIPAGVYVSDVPAAAPSLPGPSGRDFPASAGAIVDPSAKTSVPALPPQLVGSTPSSNNSDTWKLIVGVTVGIGGGGLLVVAAVIAVLRHRKRCAKDPPVSI